MIATYQRLFVILLHISLSRYYNKVYERIIFPESLSKEFDDFLKNLMIEDFPLLRLQKMEVFETKTLDTLLERKLEENERKIKESEERSLEGQKREQAMAKNCEQFAQKYNELMANYREAKEVLGPLVEGSQEKVKVNQFVG